MRELDRRIADSEDRTRYLLVSVFTPRFALYYDVSEDTFAMNDPASGTLFKRRRAAQAIQRSLQGHVDVLQCLVSRRGRLIKGSVPRLRASWSRRRRRQPAGRRHA